MKLSSHLAITASALSTLFALVACGGDSESAGQGGSTTTSTTSATSTTTDTGPRAVTSAELAGTWASAGCEAYDDGMGGKTYLTRSFTMTTTTWHLDLVVFGDDACKAPLFQAAIDGPYTLGELSATVKGATEAEFGFQKNVWTAKNDAMAATFTGAMCGALPWQVDAPQDVSATGCIGVAHAVAECPEEHDLVAVDGDTLHLGERITDLCKADGRPKALGPYGLVKKP